MPEELIVHDLQKSYGDCVALAGASFAVAAGEIFGLLGKNGAGKTTAMECIVGLRRPDGGSVQLHGIDALAHPRRIRPHIGVQLQATALQDRITPRQALRLFACFYPRAAAVERLIERFDLGEKADAPFDRLSGGQRQRLALALAFVHQPPLLFLDEPTAGLDAQSRRQLHEQIVQMRDEGRAVLLTTHDIAEAEQLCDRVAILHQGKIIADAPPEELIARGRRASRVDVLAARPLTQAWLEGIVGVTEARRRGQGWRLRTAGVAQTVSELVRRLEAEGNQLVDLHVRGPSLEETFLELTGQVADAAVAEAEPQDR
jgi:ABC-2 type transport system ATP-binding protein